MKYYFLFLFLTFGHFIIAQNNFEPGYYISENGIKTEGLIKNEDWKNNPGEFKFKSASESEITIHTIENIREFAIPNKWKYIKATVNIDQSSNNINLLSRQALPEFIKKVVFLKLLVSGEASLYIHEEKHLKNFFFSISGSPIEPLIYKKYVYNESGTNEIKENRTYQQQLFNSMPCTNLSYHIYENTKYSNNDLIDFFTTYNTCKGNVGENFSRKKRMTIHSRIRPGINFSSLEMSSQYDKMDYGEKTNFRLGIEAELMLPFNNDKWAITLEPTYQKYLGTGMYREKIVEADYSSIDLPIGLRHYFYLNPQSRFFVNAAYVLAFPLKNSIIRMETFSDMPIIDLSSNFALGAGFGWKKLSVEARYHTNRNVLINYNTRSSSFETVSFILGYEVF